MPAVARIVLVGLPGAGKSTVGPLVARRLGWRFVDLDAEVERAAQRTVAQIFADEGEAGFRAREVAATQTIASQDHLVVAAGGGWVTEPANWGALGPGALTVYLRVSPGTALARLGASGGGRPLLAGANPAEKLAQLLAARESMYLQANHTVSADLLGPDEVAAIIVALATQGVGD